MFDKKLVMISLPEDLDREIKNIAKFLSTDKNPITYDDIIRTILCNALKIWHDNPDIARAHFELGIPIEDLTEMDPETIKTLLVVMK